eukprot:1367316-Prymnesium_polylepis.1
MPQMVTSATKSKSGNRGKADRGEEKELGATTTRAASSKAMRTSVSESAGSARRRGSTSQVAMRWQGEDGRESSSKAATGTSMNTATRRLATRRTNGCSQPLSAERCSSLRYVWPGGGGAGGEDGGASGGASGGGKGWSM